MFAAGLALALDSLAAILVLSAGIGIGNAISQPAEFSSYRDRGGSDTAAQPAERLRGDGPLRGDTPGPAIGGILAAAGGTEIALLVNAATFAVLAGAAAALHARRPARPERRGGARPRARDGVGHLFRDRTLGVRRRVAFVSLLFMTASATAEVFFLSEDVGVGTSSTGSFSPLDGRDGDRRARRRAADSGRTTSRSGRLIAVGVQGIGLGLPTLWLVAWFAGAMWLIGGVAHGTKNVLVRTLIQERVPNLPHGQAFAAYNGLRNGAEFFALAAGGLLVAAIGARETLALAGLPALAALAGLALYRRPRAPETELAADPVPADAAIVGAREPSASP